VSFFGVGGLEFLVIFGVALFLVGPKRLAEGIRTGRKYYTELKRYRDELTSLVTEAIDADELKKDLERTKRDVWDDSLTREITGIGNGLALDQGDLDLMGPVPVARTSSRAKPLDRGDGTVNGEDIPSMGLEPTDISKPTSDAGRDQGGA
jgi:Sec-independent protein translocase protein TatA